MWAGFELTIQRNTWKNRIGCDIISALWSAVWNASIWLAVTEFQLSTAGLRMWGERDNHYTTETLYSMKAVIFTNGFMLY